MKNYRKHRMEKWTILFLITSLILVLMMIIMHRQNIGLWVGNVWQQIQNNVTNFFKWFRQ